MGLFVEPFLDPLKNGSVHFFLIFGVPKWVQKGEFISGVAALGAPLELQADCCFKKWAHSAPRVLRVNAKCLKNDPERAKKYPKSDPESALSEDSYTELQICTETAEYSNQTPTTQKDIAQNVN